MKLWKTLLFSILIWTLSLQVSAAVTGAVSCEQILKPQQTLHDFVASFILKSGRMPNAHEVPAELQYEYKQAALASEPQDKTKEFVDFDSLIDETANFIAKNGGTPKLADLVEATGLSESRLVRYFSKKSSPKIPGLVALAKQKYPEIFRRYEKEYAQYCAKYLKENFRFPTNEEAVRELQVSDEELNDIYGASRGPLLRVREYFPKAIETLSNKLINEYAAISRKLQRLPTVEEFAEQLEIPLEQMQLLLSKEGIFDSISELKKKAISVKEEAFKNVLDTEIFNQERMDKMLTAIKNRSRLIVTTAVAYHRVDQEALAALQKMAKEMDAEILVFPANFQTTGLDPVLLNTPGVHIITHKIELSQNLRLNNIKLQAKQIKPSTGLDRVMERQQIQILGSPKFEVSSTATQLNEIYPTRTVTTGAITLPDYQGSQYQQGRTDEMARETHNIGALVLEKTYGSDNLLSFDSMGDFNMRHVEYIAEKKGFEDLNKFYTADSVKTVKRVEGIVFGDIHVGATDRRLMNSYTRQVFELKPDYVVLHDILDGYSISHHDSQKVIKLSEKYRRGELNLEQELNNVIGFINSIMAMDPSLTIVIVGSNHNDWLSRWLQRGEYTKDPINSHIGIELASIQNKGKNALQTYIQDHVSFPKRLRFPSSATGFKIGPEGRLVEVAQHGHGGANGAKGSTLSNLRGYDRGVSGHTHSMWRYHNTVNVGTSTYLRHDYAADGYSNWSQSAAVVGKNGEIQLIEFRNGEWYRPLKDVNILNEQKFFAPGYPRVLPNNADVDKKLFQLN